MKTLLIALGWESLQNAPLIIGLMLSISIYKTAALHGLMFLVGAAIISAGLIELTEHRIGALYDLYEPPSLATGLWNAFLFSLGMGLALLYYGAQWAWLSWWSDLALGLMLGGAVGITQDSQYVLRYGRWLHGLALAVAAALTLVMIRWGSGSRLPSLLMIGSSVTIVISLLIVMLDYWPKFKDTDPII